MVKYYILNMVFFKFYTNIIILAYFLKKVKKTIEILYHLYYNTILN